MIKRYYWVAACLAAVGLQAGPLLPLQDRGDTTYDPNTGLEWLDLRFSAGHSYQSVLNGWNDYTTSQGFRFATRAEVTTLFTDAGALAINSGYSAANSPAATSLLSLLGPTLSLSDSDRGWMFYDPATEPGLGAGYAPSAVLGIWRAPSGDEGTFLIPGISALADYSSPEMASALVRVVPEPASSILFTLALVFLWSGATGRAKR